jgi:hypothetical protein
MRSQTFRVVHVAEEASFQSNSACSITGGGETGGNRKHGIDPRRRRKTTSKSLTVKANL